MAKLRHADRIIRGGPLSDLPELPSTPRPAIPRSRPGNRSSYAYITAAMLTGAVTIHPTRQARTPMTFKRNSTSRRPNIGHQWRLTTRRLTSIAVQKSSFRSMTSGSANV